MTDSETHRCYYNSYGQEYCNGSTWGNWARWLVLALIVLGAFFIFFLFSYVQSRPDSYAINYLRILDASQHADGEEWATSLTEELAGRSDAHHQATLRRNTTTPHHTTHHRPRTTNLITTTPTTRLLRLGLRRTVPRATTTAADRTMLSSSSLRTLTSHRKIRRQDDIRCCRGRRT